MADTASSVVGIASRYATALFETAKETGDLAGLEQSVSSLREVLAIDDVKDLISNPVYTRNEQARAIVAVGQKAGVSKAVLGVLDLMAKNRRLFTLPQMLDAVSDKIKQDKGIVTADVVSAAALSGEQEKSLVSTLAKNFGHDVELNLSVDPSLIGGMIVKVGSKMVDTSIKSKLSNLQNTMKEVG